MKILPKRFPSEPKSGAWIWIFLIFDAKVASTGPGTYLKRCGSKFCVGWWSEYLHSSHMDPIGEETVGGPLGVPLGDPLGDPLGGLWGTLWGGFGGPLGVWAPFGSRRTSHHFPMQPLYK